MAFSKSNSLRDNILITALPSYVVFLLAAISCSFHLLPQVCQAVAGKNVCFGSAALDSNGDLQLQHQHRRQEFPPSKTAPSGERSKSSLRALWKQESFILGTTQVIVSACDCSQLLDRLPENLSRAVHFCDLFVFKKKDPKISQPSST